MNELYIQLFALPKTEASSELVDIEGLRQRAIRSSSESNRLDKEDTGLKYTIIKDEKNNLVSLYNSVNHKDNLQNDDITHQLAGKVIENLKPKKNKAISAKRSYMHPTKEDHIKVIYGEGGFGKVRLGRDMLTGKFMAVKKMNKIAYADSEIYEKNKLENKIANETPDRKKFLTANNIAVSYGKNGIPKAYVTSDLQEGDGLQAVEKILNLKNTKTGEVTDADQKNIKGSEATDSGQKKFEREHGKFILKTMDTLEVLNKQTMVHGDLKWANMIGGKIADIDGLCYNYGDPLKFYTPDYLPPDLKRNKDKSYYHPSEASYNKHTSFTFGRMLLESIDPKAKKTFELNIHYRTKRPAHGYSEFSYRPNKSSTGKKFSPYEKDIIELAYRLADTEPEKRPSIKDAKKDMLDIIKNHNLPASDDPELQTARDSRTT